MINSELAAQVTALAAANRRAVVLTDNPDFRIFAAGYNAALSDLLVSIGEPETARKLEVQAEKMLGEEHAP